jgi:hypothetical protein
VPTVAVAESPLESPRVRRRRGLLYSTNFWPIGVGYGIGILGYISKPSLAGLLVLTRKISAEVRMHSGIRD